MTCHFFICDITGRSVVVEWIDNEMQVIETSACTNSALTPGYLDDFCFTIYLDEDYSAGYTFGE